MTITKKLVPVIIACCLLFSLILPSVQAQAAAKFSDVDPQRYGWAMDAISFMTDRGILNGYPDNTFKPGNSLTKAEFTAMLYRLFDKYRPNMQEEDADLRLAGYADVPETHWAHKEITSIYDYYFGGIAFAFKEGVEEPFFQPEKKLTRLELAQIMYMAIPFADDAPGASCQVIMGMTDIPYELFASYEEADEYRFDGRYSEDTGISVDYYVSEGAPVLYPLVLVKESDGSCSSSFDDYSGMIESAVTSMHTSGIMTADDSGYFRPHAPVSRAEAVTILNRTYNYLKANRNLQQYSSLEASSDATGTPVTNPQPEPPAGKPSSTVNPAGNVKTFTRDLAVEGELETMIDTEGYHSITVSIEAKEKVDLIVQLGGKKSFIRHEELPQTIALNGIKQVSLETQKRVFDLLNRDADYTAVLTVELK